MADRVNISVGLTADIQDFIKSLQAQFGNLKGLGLDKAAKGDIDNIMKMLNDLSKSMASLGGNKVNTSTFAKAQKEILDKVQMLETRTNALEENMTSLISTMSKADGGKFADTLKDISDNMEKLQTTTVNTVDAIQQISQVNTSGLQQEVNSLEKLAKTIESITEGDVKSVKIEANVDSIIEDLTKLSDKYEELQYEFATTDAGTEKYSQLRTQIIETAKSFQELYTSMQLSVKGNIADTAGDVFINGEKLSNIADWMIDDLTDLKKEVANRIEAINEEIRKVGNVPVQHVTSQIQSATKNNALTVPLDISTKSSTLLKRAIEIVDTVNEGLKGKPIEAQVVLTTAWGTRKSNELLKQFQSQIDNLSKETDVTELQKLADSITSSFGSEIDLKFKSNFTDEVKKIARAISALKQEVGRNLVVNPRFKLRDEDIAKFKEQIDEISNSLKVTVEKATDGEQADLLDNQTLKADEESLARIEEYLFDIARFGLNTEQALKPMYNMLYEINNLLSSNPLAEITAEVKELADILRQAFGIMSADELNQAFANIKANVEGITGSLKNADNLKAIKDVLRQFNEYQSAGGKNTLKDLGGTKNVQSWLSRHSGDNIENSISSLKEEATALHQVEAASRDAATAKGVFADQNEKVDMSARESADSIAQETDAMHEFPEIPAPELLKWLQEIQNGFNSHPIELGIELDKASLQNGLKEIAPLVAEEWNKKYGTTLTGKDVVKAWNDTQKQAELNRLKEREKEISDEILEIDIKEAELDEQRAYGEQQIAEILKENAERKQAWTEEGGIIDQLDAEAYRRAWEESEKYKQELKEINDAKAEGIAQQKAYNKEVEQYAKLFQQAEIDLKKSYSKNMTALTDSFTNVDSSKYVDSIREQIEKLQSEIIDLNNHPIDLSDNNEVAYFEDLIKRAADLKLAMKDANNQLADPTSVGGLKNKIANFLKDNTRMSNESRNALEQMYDALDKGANITKPLLKQINEEFRNISASEIKAGQSGDSFFTKISKQLKSMNANLVATYLSWRDIIRYIRATADAVVKLDSALTELRKVSDASTERLAVSFEKSAQTAQELGSTISHVINVTADWARLGYDVDAAEELARVTTLFTTVGDNMSADDASSYLISTLQGFQLGADKAEEIVDKYNEVANNFAIDTRGIGEALQRSAASFNAANTDLSKSIALVTTANTVVQNPESVGTLWKTMSARIRGAKTELEELGEEEDEFTKTTSKLRDLVKGLTGFDIMEDEDTFKDIYDIIVGIGKEWDNLTDIEQASLGEALAGKRNANALFATLNNIETLEAAYKKAEEAEGSAAKEQENYAQSVQYSIDRVKASLEELAYDFLNSGALKSAIELFNTLIRAIDYAVEHMGLLASSVAIIGGGIGLKKLEPIMNFIEGGEKLGAVASKFVTVGKGVETVSESLDDMAGGLVATREAAKGAGIQLTAMGTAFAWLAGAAVVIAGVAIAWDALTTTVEETRAEIEKTETRIQDITNELSELRKLEFRTDAQETRLGMLEQELQTQEKLLEIEKQRQAIELYDSKFSDQFDSENVYNQYMKDMAGRENILNEDNQWVYTGKSYKQTQLTSEYERMLELQKEMNEAQEEASRIQDEYNKGKAKQSALDKAAKKSEKASKAYRDANVEAMSTLTDLYEEMYDYQSKYLQAQEALESGYLAQGTQAYNNALEMRDQYKAWYEADKETATEIAKALGQYDYSKEIESVFQHSEFDGVKDILLEWAKNGQLADPQKLIDRYPVLMKEMKKAGVEAENLYDWLIKIANADPTKAGREKLYNQILPKLDTSKSLDKAVYDKITSLNDEELQILIDADIDWSTFSPSAILSKIQQLIDKEEPIKLYATFEGTDLGRRIQHLNDLLTEEKISYREYFDGLQEELNSLDTSQFTRNMQDASNAAAQFFVDSTQTSAIQLDTLIHKFEEGEIGISEYLDSYIGIANTVSSLTDVLQTNSSAWNAEGKAIDDATNEKLDQAQANLQSAVEELESYQSAIYALTQIQPEMNLDTSSDEYNAYVDEVASAMQRIADEGGKDADLIRDRLGNTSAEIAESLKSNVANLSVAEQAMSNETNAQVTTMAEAIGTLFDELGQAISHFHVELTFTSDAKGLQDVATRLLNGQAIHFSLDGSSSTLSAIGSAISNFGKQIAQNIDAQTTTHDDYHLGENENYKPKNVPDINQAKKAGGGAGKAAGDAYVDAFNKELENLKNAYERGDISLKDYLAQWKALIQKFFADNPKYAEEYANQMKSYLDGVKGYFSSAISGVGTILQGRISKLQKEKDKAVKALEKEKEAALAGYQAQIDAIDKTIKAKNKQIKQLEKEKKAIDKTIKSIQNQIKVQEKLKKEIEEKIKPLEDEIDAIQKANEERKKELDLQKDLYEQERLQNQRTQFIYKDNQMVYQADPSAARDARERVKEDEDQKKIDAIQKQIDAYNEEIEEIEKIIENYNEQIEALEEQKELIDEQIEAINEEIEALEEEKEAIEETMKEIEEYYDKLIKETEEMFDEMIEGLEEVLEKWQRLSEIETIANAWKDVGQVMEIFGYSVEDVLNDVPGAFDTFEAAWIGVLGNMSGENEHFIQGLADASGKTVEEVRALMSQIGDFGQAATKPAEEAGKAVEDVGTKASTAAGGMSNLASSTSEAAGSTTELADGLSKIGDNLDFGEVISKIEDLKRKFEEVRDSIITGPESIKGAIDALNNSVNLEGVIDKFTSLQLAIASVISAIGGGVSGSSQGGADMGASAIGQGADSAAGSAGSLISALEELNAVELGGGEGGGIIDQFEKLKEAIDASTNAIDGSAGGGEGEGEGGGVSGHSSGGASGGEGEGGGTFVDALDNMKETADEVIGGEESGVIGSFTELEKAIVKTGQKIGPEDSESVIARIRIMEKESEPAIHHVEEMFDQLAEAIAECVSQLGEIESKLKNIQSIAMNFNFGSISGGSSGGKTKWTGTANLKGIANLHGNWGYEGGKTLIAELGPELVVFPDGHYETFDKPQIANLPKGSVIFNHLQTEDILDGKNQVKKFGKSNANGSGIMPLSGDSLNQMINLANAISGDTSIMKADLGGIKRHTEEISRTIQNTTNNSQTTNISFGDMNFTCNGVSAPEVMSEVQNALNRTFEGMALNAYQKAMAH